MTQWFELLSGQSRNMYDRFVHLRLRPARGSTGVGSARCVTAASVGGWRSWLALAAVTAISGLYEIFEWLLTLVLAGPLADDYNGQQGDIWDAQKDMALALLGGVIAAAALRLTACRSTRAAGSTGPPATG